MCGTTQAEELSGGRSQQPLSVVPLLYPPLDQVLQFFYLPFRSFLSASDSFAASASLEMSKKRPAEPESRVKQQAALGNMTCLPCFSPESVE